MNPEISSEFCEECEDEKSPFEMTVSEIAISVNGTDWLANLMETTPAIVCQDCEKTLVEKWTAWEKANDEMEAQNQTRMFRVGE